MKGHRTSPAGPVGCCPESVDLSLTGLPPPMTQRPNSASAPKPLTRSISVVAGSESRKRALEAMVPEGSRAINNLRRSNSATQVPRVWSSPLRPAESPDFLALFEGSPSSQKRLGSLGKAPSEQGATWNILDEQPRAVTLMSCTQSPSTMDAPAGPQRRECSVALSPSFTANNRSSKAAVGNRVMAMVHNQHSPAEKAPPPKSSNHTSSPLNNIVKAATDEGHESSSFRKPQKNLASSKQVAQNNMGATASLLKRKEVTEEEAERFIHQVNQAAVTIQCWYRRQAQRRHRQGTSRLEHLLASKREERRQRQKEGNLLDLHQQKETTRRKAREEKARQARQAAIQELQQKRAQKSGDEELRLPRGLQPPQEASPGQGSVPGKPHKANNTGMEDPRQHSSDPLPEPQSLLEDKFKDNSSWVAAAEDLEPQAPAIYTAKPQAALQDLLATLRLLEEEPEPLPWPRAYSKDRYTWTDEEESSSLTADNLEHFRQLGAAEPPGAGTLLSEAKLQSIMSFLDEMEQAGQERPASAPQGPEPTAEASSMGMQLRLEVEEKRRAVGLLQRALAQQRDLTARRVKDTERELGRQLGQQREHYEATIQRHLAFIDQLIEDKKALSQKCETLVAELKLGDQRHKERAAQMQEQHELEIKKLKELMSATEKVRREKWINEKTRKIKEITVRGLEPEIQKLITKHKQEVKRLQGLHAAELQQAEERAAQQYSRRAEELRAQLESEKEALGQQERERAQQRFEQHLEQEQRALQQQRRRLYSEVAEEKERLGQQAARQRAELEELQQQLEESSAAGGRALRAEFEKEREGQERRHQMELKALKEQLEVERQMWEANCSKKEEAWLLSREQELKEEIRRGRDQEIELVIRRLEADTTLAREESERAAESRIQRLRDKYEAELAELERSERQLQERCTQLKGQLGEAEGEAGRLQALLRQKEKELADTRAVNEQLTAERSGLAQVLHQEFTGRLAASEEENRQLRAELAALRTRQQLELEQLTRDRQAELEAVHRRGHRAVLRVKVALAKKEEAVSSLRKQHEP
ncbi:centrosomal protein of 131 kDa isoform X3 [Erinaceus europaeus]|uniref:Centrosomal protein of 131 kDa isoform X3 n=1 Tax=Erinaceus europaeus TaxID=9365 RepID=A0ABM3VTY2_ERIEU|nr:centrosomal protein of 131 kDa isoform X3 [Erinaceus europaeus]